MTAWFLLFFTSVLWIFVIGFQSRAVNSGQYMVAAPTSFLIGFLQVSVLGDVLSPDASMVDTLIYCSGGMFGIVLAMWTHKNILPRFFRKDTTDAQGTEGLVGPEGPPGPPGRDCSCPYCTLIADWGGPARPWSAVH